MAGGKEVTRGSQTLPPLKHAKQEEKQPRESRGPGNECPSCILASPPVCTGLSDLDLCGRNVLGLLFASPAAVLEIILLKMCWGVKLQYKFHITVCTLFSPPTCWVSNGMDQTGKKGKGVRQPFCGRTGLDFSVCFCPLMFVCLFFLTSFYFTT